MPVITKEEIDALYQPLPIEAHDIREGHKNKAGDKIQWFVYADRYAVQKRLESLFPGEFEVDYSDPYRDDDHTSIICRIRIRGLTRASNGGQGLRYASDEIDHESEKGAATDAFRRAASMWGIGLYLYEGFTIWTPSYPDKEYKVRDERVKEARDKFASMYRARFGAPAPSPTGNGNGNGASGDDDAQTFTSASDFAAWCIAMRSKYSIPESVNIGAHILNIRAASEHKGGKAKAEKAIEQWKASA